MVRTITLSGAVLAASVFSSFTLMPTVPAAAAVVYCKTAGVPKGCVVRPTNKVVYCTAVGVPKGCVVRPGAVAVTTAPGVGVGAPGVGVAPGTVGNRGGPVNRVGRR